MDTQELRQNTLPSDFDTIVRVLPDLAEKYAKAYNADSGDSLTEYVRRASFDVFPVTTHSDGERAEFRRMLRGELCRSQRNN